ncbi:DUF5130 family protein [Marmoricola sp. RAF53]|uniref:DUF5130 family protein n=1 Tax=Marmoricola sp. RAF53 TaxID=3233059 RepID=UPI003F946CB9
MARGDGFSDDQRYEIDRAIRAAETVCRYEFSVYVGASDGEGGPFAQRLHASLIAPSRSILIMVDPAARLLEIVTGSVVRRELSDDSVRLAAVAMQSAFAQGDLLGGITRGVAQLADAARKPVTLHA